MINDWRKMRKTIERYYDKNHAVLIPDKSFVRWEDNIWLFHGAWLDPDTGKIKVLLSSQRNGKMRLVHDRDRREIELEYTTV